MKVRAIDAAYAAEAGLFTETDARSNGQRLNWNGPAKALGPCLTMRYLDIDGEAIAFKDEKNRNRFLFALRPLTPYMSKPKKGDGEPKPRKYERPKGSKCRLYFVRQLAGKYADKNEPLIITESELKALSAASNGFAAVGISGVDGWGKARKTAADGTKIGPRQLLDDFKKLNLRGRTLRIIFDSDVATNENVARATKALTNCLRDAGASVTIIPLPPGPNSEKQGLDDYLFRHGAEALQKLIDETEAGSTKETTSAATKVEPRARTPKPPPPPLEVPDGVPIILLATDEHRVNQEAIKALVKDRTLYKRGGALVQIVEQVEDSPDTETIRRYAGAPVIRDLPAAMLREKLSEFAYFMKTKVVGENRYQTAEHPPDWCVSAIQSRGNWPGIRNLVAIVGHPVMLPNGSILARDGYDPGTGLLVQLDTDVSIDVPGKPTRDDAKAAVVVLLDSIRDFPFAGEEYKSAMVAGMLTSLAWLMFDGPAPLFLIDKNVRSAGAGLLADVPAIMLTGRRSPVMAYSAKSEEMRKKITTLAIAGERLAMLDNLSGPVGSDVLDAALTTTVWRDRVLSTNREYVGPLEIVWWGTGNNIALRADTSRRVCHILLNSEEENPELRTDFKYPNLREHINQNRSVLLSAALTILRAWHVAGRPTEKVSGWGSYEGWSAVVRQAVMFAGMVDPGKTRDNLQAEADRPAASMREIIRLWPNLRQTNAGLSAAEIVANVKAETTTVTVQPWAHEMRDAIEELCGKLDGQSLGYKFRSFQKRNFGGQMITKAPHEAHSGSNRWIVTEVVKTTRKQEMPNPSTAGGDRRNASADNRFGNSGVPSAGDAGDVVGVTGEAKWRYNGPAKGPAAKGGHP
ncbi:MAG: DUF3854 domain-containing protein [Gemmataceae bacterium]|nr:DUF3854 domain-containing protein [Gemmataceae bacterium]